MTHPFTLPDPEGQAARDTAKPMAPRKCERVMARDGRTLIPGPYTLAYMQKHSGVSGQGGRYDIIAALDSDGRVIRTAEGEVAFNFTDSFSETVARFEDLPPAQKADFARTAAKRAKQKAQSPGVMAGAVRALEWHHVDQRGSICHDHHVASALGGAFHVAPDEDSAAGSWILQWCIRHEDFCMSYGGAISRHPGPEAAKAAAQADYERRILSALAPAARVVTAGFVQAVRDVIEGRGMFGIEPRADLDWALHHLGAAMRQIAEGK